MKKPLVLFLIMGLAIGLGASTAQAISLNFSPVSQEVIPGNQVVVDLVISGLGDGNAPSLGAFDLDVTFDPAILSFNQVVFGDRILGDQLDLFGHGSIWGFTPGTDSVNLYELSLDLAGDLDELQASEFVLASLSFNSVGAGSSLLSFQNVILGDSLAATLEDISFGGGSVTVTATTPVPEPATILLLAAGISGLGFVRRRRLMSL